MTQPTEGPSKDLQPLGESSSDTARALLKGALSAIPILGGVVSEIVGTIIPDQRIERLEDYVRQLGEQLATIDHAEIAARMTNPESVDLFEDGAFASARALSSDKRERIARLVANGISGDDQSRIEAKRLIALIAQLDDDQVIRLTSYLHRNQRDRDFHVTHEAVLAPSRAHLGSSRDELDKAVVRDLGREELLRLGLLRERFKKLKKGELPELDEKTGRMKVQSREISPLGRLLLRRLGLAADDEF